MPFPGLLLHKLQGWDDHRKMKETWKRRKAPTDAADIKRMLALTRQMNELGQEMWNDQELFDDDNFVELTRRRVKKYCELFPKRKQDWAGIGFEVGLVDDPTTEEEDLGDGDDGQDDEDDA